VRTTVMRSTPANDSYKGGEPNRLFPSSLSALPSPTMETARGTNRCSMTERSSVVWPVKRVLAVLGNNYRCRRGLIAGTLTESVPRVYQHADVKGWGNFGLVFQAYTQGAPLPCVLRLTLLPSSRVI